jgi:predicted amidohydrolase
MLQTPIVSVQLNFRVCETVDEFAETVRRLVGLARAKDARLVVFPELTGLMLLPALLAGWKPSLARTAGRGKQRGASVAERLRGLMAGSVAGALGADLREQSLAWISGPNNMALLHDTYVDVFTRIAVEFRTVVVAGTTYRPVPGGGFAHSALVFGADGAMLGSQDQVHLVGSELLLVTPGESFSPIVTPVGTLGILVGSDALFPEAGRALAYAGAEVLVNPAACPGSLSAEKVRRAFEARVAENELFGIESFLVGANPWAVRGRRDRWMGRSVILGPIELVPRPGGVLMEMGESVEGALATTLDLPELHRWWDLGAGSLRRAMRPGVYARPLADQYRSGQTIQGAYEAGQVKKQTSSSPPVVPAPPRLPAEVTPGPGLEPIEPSSDVTRAADVAGPPQSEDAESASWPADPEDRPRPEDAERARFWD